MSTELEKKGPARPTGRRFKSVKDLLRENVVVPEVERLLADLEKETGLVAKLALLRQQAGLTQAEMAQRLGVTQSAVSKLETGPDENLTVRELREYARHTNQRIGVMFGRPLSHVEAVKHHAFRIRERLNALAELAHKDAQLEQAIQGFFGEAFFNILTILSQCQQQLPAGGGDVEVRLQVVGNSTLPGPRRLDRPLDPAAG